MTYSIDLSDLESLMTPKGYEALKIDSRYLLSYGGSGSLANFMGGPDDTTYEYIGFYSGTTKELEVVHSYLPNTTNMLNVGKVSGAVHDNADDGSNDLVTVWGDAGCSTTQLSSENEAAASQAYTQ